MNPEAAAILGGLTALALRALISWLIERYVTTAEGGTAAQIDADLGDAGSGDTRIMVFEGPKLQRIRQRLTGKR